ncbi:uncharacterized protein AC631_00889 [Debaryomyces fabryi]|uniref:BHLH domain-containing protein n=1 Tax=Debaryomyces fabryi TaxID=58627 RepID=A0A0V1Q4R8_9ASCO|nr:uncharacterized protein AC631_00889 [Debaryomyces fabryi]KSA03404.1 hypothetical protein AC631_00889 [Debaryomyces fabryi]CUM50030.1 unnamed protein product [Debaryomyces fabryi]
MTTTNTFEFDNEFYNFDNANEFLENISGAVSSLSPLSEDEQFKSSIVVDSNWASEGVNQNEIFRNKGGDDFNIINQEYSNPSINNGDGDNAYFNLDSKIGTDMKAPNNLISSSMSSGTYSQDSTNNGMTPISQHSLTSAHTSPELLVKIEENEDASGKMKSLSTSKSAKVTKPHKKDKSSHNMIEKKYRTNINSKILALRDAVPSLRIVAGNKDVSMADLEGLTPASKLNKASVLTKATEYIKHLEQKNDILKEQNTQLQKLIQEANLRSQPIPQEQALPSQRGGFGYVPPQNEQSFNSTPGQDFGSGSFNFNNQNAGMGATNPSYNYNKILLGSLATVMGTSLMADNGGEFKGLSALPFSGFLPYFITHPNQMTIQLWSLLKVLLVFGSLASIILPNLFITMQNDKKSDEGTIRILKFWLLNSLGLQLPHSFEQEKVDNILLLLSGKSEEEFSWTNLLKYYIYLTSCEATFELCFLNLIVGTILSIKFPLISKFINYNMTLKGSLLLNFKYKGDNQSLMKLNDLIHNLDGISMLGSASLLKRLINIAEHKNINEDVYDGQNKVKYVELFQENRHDYYSTIVTWRILEITHELNLAYLKNMASNTQEKSKVFKQITDDVNKIEAILLNDTSTTSLRKYFSLFKSVVEEQSAPKLLGRIETDVHARLYNFENATEESESMNEDVSDFSEEDDETDQTTNYSAETETQINSKISSRKSLISSLSLVSEEQFIILASSLILYYHHNNKTNSKELLKYLNFSTEQATLSLLSFTALLKILTKLIDQNEDFDDFKNSNVLDKLIRITRLWINDDKKQFLDYNLRCDLSDLIVSKGLILNGVLSDENDEEREDK